MNDVHESIETSPQKTLGNVAFDSIHLTLSRIVLLNLFARPFYCGVIGVVRRLLIPYVLHNSENLSFKVVVRSKEFNSFAGLILNQCFPIKKIAIDFILAL